MVRVVDVSEPASPREVNRVAAQEARWVSVAGSRAYLVDPGGLRILDLFNPAHPHQLPVSVEDLKAGHFNPERLAEMDYILTSLTWK